MTSTLLPYLTVVLFISCLAFLAWYLSRRQAMREAKGRVLDIIAAAVERYFTSKRLGLHRDLDLLFPGTWKRNVYFMLKIFSHL